MLSLAGKTAVVTGANSGMGMATAAALADMGAQVVMLCRSEERGRQAYEKLMEVPCRRLCLMLCDLGDFDSVSAFANSFAEQFGCLDILVNNAGFISLDRQLTKNGLERQFGVNHMGHFLLTGLLLPFMPRGGRIVNVSSGAHKVGKIHFKDINLTKGYNVVKAYSQSKLCNVLFTRYLAEKLKDRGITVNCCHPGAVATNMGVSRDTGFGRGITGLLKPFFLTPQQGAQTAVYLVSSPQVKDISGEYFYKCRVAPSSKRSKDMQLAQQLFALSVQLCGFEYRF